MALHLRLNGQPRSFDELNTGDSLEKLITTLDLKGDRVAIEQNGEIVPRSTWPEIRVAEGDRLEIVHFVGGGAPA